MEEKLNEMEVKLRFFVDKLDVYRSQKLKNEYRRYISEVYKTLCGFFEESEVVEEYLLSRDLEFRERPGALLGLFVRQKGAYLKRVKAGLKIHSLTSLGMGLEGKVIDPWQSGGRRKGSVTFG